VWSWVRCSDNVGTFRPRTREHLFKKWVEA
jgi:hypothetical protein